MGLFKGREIADCLLVKDHQISSEAWSQQGRDREINTFAPEAKSSCESRLPA